MRRRCRRRMEEMNRGYDAIGNSPFAASVARGFLLEEGVHCPFDFVEEIFGQEQSQFVGVGDFFSFVEPAGPKLARGSRGAFIVKNIPDSGFVFGENRWV